MKSAIPQDIPGRSPFVVNWIGEYKLSSLSPQSDHHKKRKENFESFKQRIDKYINNNEFIITKIIIDEKIIDICIMKLLSLSSLLLLLLPLSLLLLLLLLLLQL